MFHIVYCNMQFQTRIPMMIRICLYDATFSSCRCSGFMCPLSQLADCCYTAFFAVYPLDVLLPSLSHTCIAEKRRRKQFAQSVYFWHSTRGDERGAAALLRGLWPCPEDILEVRIFLVN